MDLSFTSFWGQLAGNPILIITVVFTLGVIFVNGWTDAPQRHRHLRHHPLSGGAHTPSG